MTPKKFYGALVDSGKGMLEVGVSCAISGIVVGVFGLTGLGLKFSNVLVTLAGGNLFALLIMTAIASIILGMGMSTLPVYLILATLVAPALTKMGIPPIAALLRRSLRRSLSRPMRVRVSQRRIPLRSG